MTSGHTDSIFLSGCLFSEQNRWIFVTEEWPQTERFRFWLASVSHSLYFRFSFWSKCLRKLLRDRHCSNLDGGAALEQVLWLGFVFFGLQFGHPQSEFCILKQYSTKSVQACLSQLTLQEEQLRLTFY